MVGHGSKPPLSMLPEQKICHLNQLVIKKSVSVCLTLKVGRTKMKPLIVVQGAKREIAVLNKKFKHGCGVASSSNGQINKERT